MSAKTIETSAGHSGGALNYDRVWPDLRRYLLDKSTPVLTTLFDLYKLDKRFPKADEAASLGSDLEKRLEMLTQALHADIINKTGCRPERFIPYLQPYEFEALLFSDVATLVSIEPGWKKR